MKKLILASAVASVFVAHVAYAADEAAAAPEHVVAYNVGITTDYVFRGISQSRNKPAVMPVLTTATHQAVCIWALGPRRSAGWPTATLIQ